MGSNPEILGTTSRLESALADDDIPVLNVFPQVFRYTFERPSSAASVVCRHAMCPPWHAMIESYFTGWQEPRPNT